MWATSSRDNSKSRLTDVPRAWRRRRFGARGPEESTFLRTRIRLTLRYGGVLALALLLLSVAVYVGLRHMLLDPVKSQTREFAEIIKQQ
jgi:hypothetical protein